MPYHGSSHNPGHSAGMMYDKGIKEGMSRGTTTSNPAMISKGKQSPDKFVSGGGFKVIPDSGGHAMSYGKRSVSSSPMMRPQTAKKSWRSSGSRSRADRSG